MADRVFGAAGSCASVGRRRRLRAMSRGYRMVGRLALLTAAVWLGMWEWTSAQAGEMVLSGSRYSAPLWVWITAIVVAAALSVIGLGIGFWFLRKRSSIESNQ